MQVREGIPGAPGDPRQRFGLDTQFFARSAAEISSGRRWREPARLGVAPAGWRGSIQLWRRILVLCASIGAGLPGRLLYRRCRRSEPAPRAKQRQVRSEIHLAALEPDRNRRAAAL